MPKLSDVIELAVFGLYVTHELKDGSIVHKAKATYNFGAVRFDEPVEIDIDTKEGVEIAVIGVEVAPQ